MVSLDQVRSGLIRYIDTEILPNMSGMRRYGVAVYMALAADALADKAVELVNNPAISMLGVIDGNSVDLDKIRTAAADSLENDRLQLDLPVAGRVVFHRSDIDKLYQYIKNG